MTDSPVNPTQPRDDYELFVRLFAEQHRPLYLYIASLVPNRTVVDEVFQETSVVLWREFAAYDRLRPFGPWARGVALNQARKARRHHADGRLVFSADLVDQLAERQQADQQLVDRRRVALDGCLGKLRPVDRDLVDRCYRDELSFKEVADELGKPLGSLYHALSRIRRALFDCIELTVSREDGA